MAAVNYCAFRGMLNRSSIYFRGRAGIQLPDTGGDLCLGRRQGP